MKKNCIYNEKGNEPADVNFIVTVKAKNEYKFSLINKNFRMNYLTTIWSTMISSDSLYEDFRKELTWKSMVKLTIADLRIASPIE